MKGLSVDPTVIKSLQDIMYEEAGVALKDDIEELLISRLGNRIEQLKLKSFHDYLAYFNQNYSGERDYLVDALTTHETYFFRESDQLDFLIKLVKSNRIRDAKIWSAACSYGQEAFSIALLISEYAPMGNWEIHGTDVSYDAVSKASSAKFSSKEKTKIPRELFELSCFDQPDGTFSFHSSVLERTSFQVFNLLNSYKSNFFDFVFLRNVLIYFKPEEQYKIMNNCLKSLKKEGILFLGHSEKMAAREFNLKSLNGGIYQKLSH